MAKVFLASYKLQIHPTGKPDQVLPFGESFLGRLEEFFEALKQEHSEDKEYRFLHGATHVVRDEETVCGLLDSGDYGYTTRLVNVTTRKQSHKRTVDEAEMYPYYFLLYAPPSADHGVLIVQRIGARGIITVFQKRLHEYLSKRHQLILKLYEHVPSEIYNYLRKGKIKGVVFNQYRLPKDRADLVGWKVKELEEVANIKLVVKPKRGMLLPSSPFLEKQYEELMTNMEPIAPDDSDEIEVLVNYAGHERTVNFSRPTKVAPYIDISKDLKMEEGHPLFESIDDAARLLLHDILVEIGAKHVI